jgi:hypothetical protein
MQRQVKMWSGLMCAVEHTSALGHRAVLKPLAGLGALMRGTLLLQTLLLQTLLLQTLLPGCTAYEPASDTLATTSQSPLGGQAAGGQTPEVPDLGADWSCLGTAVDRAPLPGTPGAAVTYSLRLIDMGSGAPFTDANVRVCGLTDVMCSDPLGTQMKPDADGWISVPLTANFTGYLEILSQQAVPYIFLLPDAGIRTVRDFPLFIVGLDDFAALLSAMHLPFDPAVGAIAVRVFDCQGAPAPGVQFQTNSGGTPFYFESGLPNTARDQTDPDGLGGYIGSLPGVTVFESELVDGTLTSQKSMIIRPGWLTTTFMRPPQAVIR